MQDTLYREEILEHFHDPQNFGELQDYSKKSQQTNPFCGDDITVFVKFSPCHSGKQRLHRNPDSGQARMTDEEIIEEISFTGRGCAISIASASILTEFAKGKSKSELTKFSEEDMLELLGLEVSETRKKCALLALATLKDCIEK